MRIFGDAQPVLQSKDAARIVQIAVRYLLMPNPDVVRELDGAVFPVVRDPRLRGTCEEDKTKFGKPIMYDDNTTPRWAILWAHGCLRMSFPPGGWTFAHVWDESKDPDAYTHVANLVMMPESLGSLSDKNGPLVDALRFHAQEVYHWRPDNKPEVELPKYFEKSEWDKLEWTYMKPIKSPRNSVENRLRELDNQKVQKLCSILGIQRQ